MPLYHRTYTRIPLTLDVQLKFKGKNLGHAFTRNINPFGAFIELSKHELATNDFIGLYFTEKDQEHTCVEQKGLVIHRSDEGVGILFASDTEEFRTMLDKEFTHAGNSA